VKTVALIQKVICREASVALNSTHPLLQRRFRNVIHRRDDIRHLEDDTCWRIGTPCLRIYCCHLYIKSVHILPSGVVSACTTTGSAKESIACFASGIGVTGQREGCGWNYFFAFSNVPAFPNSVSAA
jgi:hypothetical protein